MVVTNYIRSLGVPCIRYIDDQHAGQLAVRQDLQYSLKWSNSQLPQVAAFVVCSVLVCLGYFIGLSKSVAAPQTKGKIFGVPIRFYSPSAYHAGRKEAQICLSS